jgi:hypothetical protein
MNEESDIVLEKLKNAVSPVLDTIEDDHEGNRAAIVLGAKEITVNGEYEGIQTFIDICGDYGILGEALYTELMSSIEEKKPELFQLLREVVRAIEEELELSDDEPLDEPRTIH